MTKTKAVKERSETGLSPLELQRIVTLREASRLSGISRDALIDNYKDKLIRASKGLWGMRVKDALQL